MLLPLQNLTKSDVINITTPSLLFILSSCLPLFVLMIIYMHLHMYDADPGVHYSFFFPRVHIACPFLSGCSCSWCWTGKGINITTRLSPSVLDLVTFHPLLLFVSDFMARTYICKISPMSTMPGVRYSSFFLVYISLALFEVDVVVLGAGQNAFNWFDLPLTSS